MKIVSAEFIKSAYERLHWPTEDYDEISFLGRSNVGKSSLLNSLLQRKALARTSNTPGRTQSINFFLVNSSFYFVDLPGYGYARVSKSVRADWGKMARDYLQDREELVLSIQLVDSRHEPTQLDRQLNEWLLYNDKPHIVVATKADKLSANKLFKQLKVIEKAMPQSKLVAYSAVTGKGREGVWSEIGTALNKTAPY
ncbi:MAG: YihA family ribosome biogenesis GTP-binding protein [Blastocatellia bacterium]|nr:YihA family ribosome biogenesis GTP-binding protein [Blastocatellia bacterium]